MDFSSLVNNVELHIRQCFHAMALPPRLLRCRKVVLQDLFHLHTVFSIASCEEIVLLGCSGILDVSPLAAPGARCRSLVVRPSPHGAALRAQLQGSAVVVDS